MKIKKKFDFGSLFLVLIIVVLCAAIYFLLPLEYDYITYIIYALIVLIVCMLSALISRMVQRRNTREKELYQNRLHMWNSISYRVKKAGESAFNELPIGILVVNEELEVQWSNNHAKRIFMSPLESMKLSNISVNLDNGLKESEKFVVDIYGKVYDVLFVKEHHIVYLTEITQMVEIQNRYQERLSAVGYINIDNLEEALSDFDVQERAEYMSKIIGVIAKWAESFGIYVRAYSDSNYLVVMDKNQLNQMMKSNFDILDEIKKVLRLSSTSRISLSIGIACIDENIVDLSRHANEQLELALKRGGDQAVVKIDEKVTFYGAKTDAVPKESRVEVRVKSEELQDLMLSATKVIVVGHGMLDADGFGGTLGLYKFAKALGRPAYMVIDYKNIDSTVQQIYNVIEKEYVSLRDDICTSSQALGLIDDGTLLMVVDCQSDYLVMESKLIKKARRVGVIDHHRKPDTGAIVNPVFTYTSTSASSSVELVVDLMDFLESDTLFDGLEATWLLLGIIVDTNNFIYRASSKTFHVAATLAGYGADMSAVKAYLKEDYNDKLVRNDFIGNLEFYKKRVGITVGKPDIIYERATLAKISDEIISVNGVDVGITIGYIKENVVGISTRSLGAINAQLLMERMGGGGHLNNAAAQVKNSDLISVKEELLKQIDEFLVKEELMKVILIKEVKGRGKKGDIIDLQTGFANHLIRNSLAISASAENLKKVEEEKREEERRAVMHLQEMKELKKTVESTPVKVTARIGEGGRMFGSVSMKQVVDEFEKQTKIALDKRKINFTGIIDALGTYDIPIQLHKEVIATIKLYVVEKE